MNLQIIDQEALRENSPMNLKIIDQEVHRKNSQVTLIETIRSIEIIIILFNPFNNNFVRGGLGFWGDRKSVV